MIMATVTLRSQYIGYFGGGGIYVIDLAQTGLPSIKSVTIIDDNEISGGSGNVSGLDVDFLKTSATLITDASRSYAWEG
jgi:hypothetical protein